MRCGRDVEFLRHAHQPRIAATPHAAKSRGIASQSCLGAASCGARVPFFTRPAPTTRQPRTCVQPDVEARNLQRTAVRMRDQRCWGKLRVARNRPTRI